jgi:uncharacterized DUF497 family protein
MKIVWDEPKRLSNIDKHGLDFADLTTEFVESAVVVTGKHDRLLAVGRLFDDAVAVVFARLGSEAISIISMRPASEKERRRI